MAKKMLEVITPTAGGTGRTVYINADAIRVISPLQNKSQCRIEFDHNHAMNINADAEALINRINRDD